MDILEPFPTATGQHKYHFFHHKYHFVTADYFTKWIEVEAVASITAAKVQKFICKNIITCFGIPCAMIFDNGQQFDTSKVTDYFNTIGCQAQFNAIAHPQTNG